MIFTDNPISDYERYSAEQYNKLQRLPKCIDCDEHIQDEVAYEFDKGLICESCIELRKIFIDIEE